MAHHRRGAVQWQVVRRIVLGILLGTFLGASLASRLSTNVLKAIFVVFLYYMGIQFLSNRKPKAGRTLPGPWGMFGVGSFIGVVSAFVGIGGGTLSVPFMIYCNLPVHTAIGTSAAIGFPIAVAGAAGYLVNGLGAANLPPWSLGILICPPSSASSAAASSPPPWECAWPTACPWTNSSGSSPSCSWSWAPRCSLTCCANCGLLPIGIGHYRGGFQTYPVCP